MTAQESAETQSSYLDGHQASWVMNMVAQALHSKEDTETQDTWNRISGRKHSSSSTRLPTLSGDLTSTEASSGVPYSQQLDHAGKVATPALPPVSLAGAR